MAVKQLFLSQTTPGNSAPRRRLPLHCLSHHSRKGERKRKELEKTAAMTFFGFKTEKWLGEGKKRHMKGTPDVIASINSTRDVRVQKRGKKNRGKASVALRKLPSQTLEGGGGKKERELGGKERKLLHLGCGRSRSRTEEKRKKPLDESVSCRCGALRTGRKGGEGPGGQG